MKFDATTAQGVNPEFAYGECRFQVEAAREKVSKKGQDMIELQLSVYDKNNVSASAFEYLLANAAWKIKDFCESVQIPFDIKNPDAELQAYMCEKKIGKCITAADEYNGQPKVSVKKFLRAQAANTQQAAVQAQAPMMDNAGLPFDDEIPFG